MANGNGIVPVPTSLETPPRTTGDPQQDLPLLVDWFYRAYQVITQAVNYINNEVSPSLLVVSNLPDPDGTTLAQAQQTANDAFSLATTNAAIIAGLVSGTFTVSELDIGADLTFTIPQVDTDYRVTIQAISFTGSPTVSSFVIKTKTYLTTKFTAILFAAPGVGNSVTFEWQLIRID